MFSFDLDNLKDSSTLGVRMSIASVLCQLQNHLQQENKPSEWLEQIQKSFLVVFKQNNQ